jgi:hypothetical protein
LYAENRPKFDTAGVAQEHSLALKYLKAPNMDLKAFKGTLTLRVLYFAVTLYTMACLGQKQCCARS